MPFKITNLTESPLELKMRGTKKTLAPAEVIFTVMVPTNHIFKLMKTKEISVVKVSAAEMNYHNASPSVFVEEVAIETLSEAEVAQVVEQMSEADAAEVLAETCCENPEGCTECTTEVVEAPVEVAPEVVEEEIVTEAPAEVVEAPVVEAEAPKKKTSKK